MHDACASGCLGACDVLEEKPGTVMCAASCLQILLFSNAKQYSFDSEIPLSACDLSTHVLAILTVVGDLMLL